MAIRCTLIPVPAMHGRPSRISGKEINNESISVLIVGSSLPSIHNNAAVFLRSLVHAPPEIVVLADRLLKALPLFVLIAVELVDRGVFHSCR